MKAVMFLAKGFEETEAISIMDVLRRGEVEVDMVSVSGNLEVEGSHGIIIRADRHFFDLPYDDYDMIVLPGGMPGTKNLQNHKELCELLKRFNHSGKWIAAICAAPMILGKLGILEGRAATCYPGFEGELKGCQIRDEDVVKSHNIITGKGVGVALKFGLELLAVCHPLSYVEALRKTMIISKYN